MNTPVIHDREGQSGIVEAIDADRLRVRLANGAALDLPATLATHLEDGSYRLDASFGALGTDATTVLHEVEEHLTVGVVQRETGRVVARTVTEAREQPVDADGWRETIEVERVPVNRPVDAAEPLREEAGVTIIPVYEEVLVVHKQLVLREEIRLTTRREPVPGPDAVTLRRQHVEIDRLPPDDAGA